MSPVEFKKRSWCPVQFKGQGPRMNQGAQLSHLHYMYMGLFSHISLLESTDVFFII